jgi:hypothetical protein
MEGFHPPGWACRGKSGVRTGKFGGFSGCQMIKPGSYYPVFPPVRTSSMVFGGHLLPGLYDLLTAYNKTTCNTLKFLEKQINKIIF